MKKAIVLLIGTVLLIANSFASTTSCHSGWKSAFSEADLTPAQKWLESQSFSAVTYLLSEETNDLFNSLQNLKNDSNFTGDPSNLYKLYVELLTIYNTYQYGITKNPNVSQADRDSLENNPDVSYFMWIFNSVFDPTSMTSLPQALEARDFSSVEVMMKDFPTAVNKTLLNAWVWNTQKVQYYLASFTSHDPDYQPVPLPKDIATILSGEIDAIVKLLQDVSDNPNHINADAPELLIAFTKFLNSFQTDMSGTTLTQTQKNTLQGYTEPFLMDIAGTYGYTANITLLESIKAQSSSELASILTDLTDERDSNRFLSQMIEDGQTASSKISSSGTLSFQSQVRVLAADSVHGVDQIGFTGTAFVLYDIIKTLSYTLQTLNDHPDYFQGNNYAYPQELYNLLALLNSSLTEIQNSSLTDDQKEQLTDAVEPFADDIFALSDGTTTIQQALDNQDPEEVQKIMNANSDQYPQLISESQTALNNLTALIASQQPPKTQLPQEQTEHVVTQLTLMKTILKDVESDQGFFISETPPENFFIHGFILYFQNLYTFLEGLKKDPDVTGDQKALFAIILAPLFQELSSIGDPTNGATLAKTIQKQDPVELQKILYQLYQVDYHYNGQIVNIDIGDVIGELEQHTAS